MEKPVTFKVNGQQVVGMVHRPDDGEGPFPAVVCLHGFTGNKQESHRLFVKTARTLAAAGMAALRIDFRGSGDSEGDFSKMTVSRELEDARAAVRLLLRRREFDSDRLGILGMSMGGLVAAHVLGECPELRAGVLWGAVADAAGSAQRKKEREDYVWLPELQCYDMYGWLVGQAFLDELPALRPLDVISKTRAAVLAVHGAADETVPVSDAYAYAHTLKDAGCKSDLRIIPEADHTFSALRWETPVIGYTFEWFRHHLGGKCNAP